MSAGVITLTTDFGLADAYVGVMKGVILGVNPDARIIDLSHVIPAQDVVAAAFLLESAWRYFPAGSVHVVVVDPGVGTQRPRLCIERDGHRFVGPDNGCLAPALSDSLRPARRVGAAYAPAAVDLPADVTAHRLENAAYFGRNVSATFEGRDVFASVAAHLTLGVAPSALGPTATTVQALPAFRAPVTPAGVSGVVLSVDRFGNLISDVHLDQLGANPVVTVGSQSIVGVERTYGVSPGLKAVVGSSGYLEVAVAGGSAAATLGVGVGASVEVR
jgi:S-adenosyl-L-methionine hydrolase (adenosine-forming)